MTWEYIAGYFDGEGTVWCSPRGKSTNKCSLRWLNNHLSSLEVMQRFMGVGRVVARKPNLNPNIQQQYYLEISKRSEMLYVLPHLKTSCIIKLPKLLEMEIALGRMRDQTPFGGSLALAGPSEISRLYWDEKMNLQAIAEKFGVTWTAVKNYMNRKGIKKRTRKEAMALANRDTEAWRARSEKIRQQRLRDWQDPDYRRRQTASLKR